MRDPDSRLCHSQSGACMQSSKIISATRWRIGISLFSWQQQLARARSSWRLARQVLSIARGHRTFIDKYELESDSRSDVTSNVTSNDASVNVNDTLNGAQAATMVLEAEARCAGSCLLRDDRSCDGRRTLRQHPPRHLSASLKLRSHWLPPAIGELVSPRVYRTASCKRISRLSVSRRQSSDRTANC